jgi:hypothetical protein
MRNEYLGAGAPGASSAARRLLWAALLAAALLAGLALAVRPAAAVGSHLQQSDEPPGKPIVIRWSTETEVNTAGFNVYRSLAEDGPWEKINPRLIPGSPDPLRGGSYVFTDTHVIAGVPYWYELEEIELSGQATRLERTTATAQREGLLPAMPCASGLGLLVFAAGMVLTGRRRTLRRPA